MNEQRSRIMRAVKSRNTAPELFIRRLAHGLGFRFRLHRKDIPGNPDMVFLRHKKAVYVHGCFWHGHSCSRGARVPKTNTEYWTNKISRNRARDKTVGELLKAIGWTRLIIWECEIKNPERVKTKLRMFLRKQN